MSAPCGSAVVENVALPPVMAAVPSEVAPLVNVTEPVGSAPLLAKDAVNFTDWPAVEGLGEETSVNDTLAGLTTCVKTGEVVFEICELPLYSAVIESEPAGKLLLVRLATPLEFSVAVPRDVVPFLNVTFPVGVEGAPDVTVTLSVTACPNTAGFRLDMGVLTELG